MGVCVCGRVRVCMHVCVCACMCAYLCVCVVRHQCKSTDTHYIGQALAKAKQEEICSRGEMVHCAKQPQAITVCARILLLFLLLSDVKNRRILFLFLLLSNVKKIFISIQSASSCALYAGPPGGGNQGHVSDF